MQIKSYIRIYLQIGFYLNLIVNKTTQVSSTPTLPFSLKENFIRYSALLHKRNIDLQQFQEKRKKSCDRCKGYLNYKFFLRCNTRYISVPLANGIRRFDVEFIFRCDENR